MMNVTYMIALAEMEERERGMRVRLQSHELTESRRAGADAPGAHAPGADAHGLRERIVRFAGTALPRRPVGSDRGAACASCAAC